MAKTIGDTSANRARWADLRDSSAEDLLDSQPAPPAAPLHDDTYIETPEPSFDYPQGSVLRNLGKATTLDAEELPSAPSRWQPNAGAPEFIPTFQQSQQGYLCNSALRAPCRSSSILGRLDGPSQSSTPGNEEGTDATASSLTRHRFLKRRSGSALNLGSRLANKRPRPGQDENGTTSASHGAYGAPIAPAPTGTAAGGEQNQDEIPAGGVSEEDWQRRHEKRLNVIRGIRSTLEYESMSSARARGILGSAAPTTPDPNDRRISKRKWETEVMRWRNDLRTFTRAPASSPERMVVLPTLDA